MADIPALLERFRRAPEMLAVALTGVYGAEEDFAAPGKWSVRQITSHLADAELVMANRFRQILAEEDPTLVAFDQDLWARNLDYARRKPKQSLETFRRLRAENYELLKGAPQEAFNRTGNHNKRGPITLAGLVEMAANHAESHTRQINQLREAYKASKASAGGAA